MANEHIKRTYMDPPSVPNMPAEELLENCKWLIESQVLRYCKLSTNGTREDAAQEARLTILIQRERYDPTYGVHFEGWVRVQIAAALVKLRLNAVTPVRIPETSFRRIGRKPVGVSINDEETGLLEQPPLSITDNTVENNERTEGVDKLHRELQRRIKRLPPPKRAAVTAYLEATPYRRTCKKHTEGRLLCAKLTRGLKGQFDDCMR